MPGAVFVNIENAIVEENPSEIFRELHYLVEILEWLFLLLLMMLFALIRLKQSSSISQCLIN